MSNRRIEIYNVGPIKEVKLDLNKVNVFMGGQGSGKSTISKIISFCSWVEKDVSLKQSFSDYSSDVNYFLEKLESFHKMKGYFNEDSEIIYESNVVKLHHKLNSFNISWVNQFEYKRRKISYVPSERNMVILPEIEKVEFQNNNIKSFLFDWFDARKYYTIENNLSILNLDIKYYYSDSTSENRIQSIDNSYDILLSNASSGLQSITPLVVMVDYLTRKIYSEELKESYDFNQVRAKVNRMLFEELIIIPLGYKDYNSIEKRKKVYDDLNDRISEGDEEVIRLVTRYSVIKDNLFETHGTDLIVEEPEQNLFPTTQKNLIYYLLNSIANDLNHNLTLTTHSPYILYAINNCIMASLVFDKLSSSEREKLTCLDSRIDPELISIYEIKNGKINYIQQEDGLIGDNFFDVQMREVMDEFYVMLNHY